ncbi:MAG: polysaccharide biosynthesis tyrosine autokinase [Bacteroidales bacterium]|nr:polysaccharide biosynthesis tyrosine autokinase [Bacteroidales bacterium]
MEQNNIEKPFVDEEESGFDIMEWVSHFLHYWYLFVIGIIISLGLAYLQNRKWLPTYKTSGTMIIEEYRTSSSTQALMQGFGVQAGYKNVDNQVIMLGSYDLVSKVVDSLPQLKVDYITKGRFKTRNLYYASPINIQFDFVAPEAYNLLFKINLNSNGKFTITVDDKSKFKEFKVDGRIGIPVSTRLFYLTVYNSNGFYSKSELYFRFRDHESLVADFTSRLNFQYVVEGSSVLEISLASESPDRDMDFINKLSETFLEDNLERKNDAANKTIKFIDSQLENISKSLSVSQDELTDFRQRNQIIDVSSHTGELMGKATQYDGESSALKLRETYLNYLTNYLRTNLEEGSVVAPSSLGLNEPMLMSLIQQLNDLNLKRSELSEKNFYYSKYTNDIENVKLAINEVIKNMRVSLDIEKSDFNKRYMKVQEEIEELPVKELEMISIERKYKMDDNYYTFFLQKRAEAEILKSSNSPDNDILDKARIMSITNAGTKSKNTMMFLLFGILIPTIIVILKELLNNTVRTYKDIEKSSSFQVIGVVRHTQTSDPLMVSKNPRSAFTETFRVIRTRIEFLVQRKKDIMILVTSGESGDGKTYFCVNLAGIYAMASPRTLLVDMDIRKPSVNGRFNISQTEGVTNFLIGQCELNDVILRLPGVDFDILPAGTVPPNAGELIRSDKLFEMFVELRKRYDFIIVDSSPIGVVADAYSLAQLSDVNLFIVRNGKTNKSFHKKLSAQLKADNMKNMYVVMNDVSTDENQYSKYYSRKYTYGYGYGYGYTSASKSKKRKDASDNYFQYYQDDRNL